MLFIPCEDGPQRAKIIAALSAAGFDARPIGAQSMAHVNQSSGQEEWYTPKEIIDAAAAALGGEIELDPASCAAANEIVGARRYFTREMDGLSKRWDSAAVWLNPPYSQPAIGQFAEKLVEEYLAERVTAAVVLVNNATETRWFQTLAASADAICFFSGRIRFWFPGRESLSPLQGQAVLYFGDNQDAFFDAFDAFGFVMEPSPTYE